MKPGRLVPQKWREPAHFGLSCFGLGPRSGQQLLRLRSLSPLRVYPRTSVCLAAAAAQRAASLPLLAFGHFPLTGGLGPPSRAQNSAAFAARRFFALAPVHPRCSARLRISLYAPQGRGNHSHAPKYAFLNCVLLPYRIGRSGVPRPYSSGKTGSVQPTDQWVRRARPFARRRARTLRPLRVAIRLRKPCSLERWRFLG